MHSDLVRLEQDCGKLNDLTYKSIALANKIDQFIDVYLRQEKTKYDEYIEKVRVYKNKLSEKINYILEETIGFSTKEEFNWYHSLIIDEDKVSLIICTNIKDILIEFPTEWLNLEGLALQDAIQIEYVRYKRNIFSLANNA